MFRSSINDNTLVAKAKQCWIRRFRNMYNYDVVVPFLTARLYGTFSLCRSFSFSHHLQGNQRFRMYMRRKENYFFLWNNNMILHVITVFTIVSLGGHLFLGCLTSKRVKYWFLFSRHLLVVHLGHTSTITETQHNCCFFWSLQISAVLKKLWFALLILFFIG